MRRRNRRETRRNLLEGAVKLIREEGFINFGINRVAKEGGCDKVLIYRYFGGLNGLLREIGLKTDLFPSGKAFRDRYLPKERQETYVLMAAYLKGYKREMRKRPLTPRLLAWARLFDNPLLRICRRERARFIESLLGDIKGADPACNAEGETLFSLYLGVAEGIVLEEEREGKSFGLEILISGMGSAGGSAGKGEAEREEEKEEEGGEDNFPFNLY